MQNHTVSTHTYTDKELEYFSKLLAELDFDDALEEDGKKDAHQGRGGGGDSTTTDTNNNFEARVFLSLDEKVASNLKYDTTESIWKDGDSKFTRFMVIH